MLMLLHVSHRVRVKCSFVQVDHQTRPPTPQPQRRHTRRDCSQGGPAVLAAFLWFAITPPPPPRAELARGEARRWLQEKTSLGL
ncbi:unnamed protein product, partial [Boreogadus saida]